MKIHNLTRELFVPSPPGTAWTFFSNPKNLPVITPPEMNFKILTKNLPEKIFSGMLIDYSLTPLFGIRTNWVTEIKEVKENEFFIDEQLKGPYALWRHKHSFIPHEKGTLMKDEVEYVMPFSSIGEMAHRWHVKKKLDFIFDYREKVISEIFSFVKSTAA
jgi:ligand-binding SRPBCC domain-containing protein